MHAAMHAADHSAIARLLAQPQRYGFMQAVRLLERWHVQQLGLGAQEVLNTRLRFRNTLSLAFPPSEIADFRPEQPSPDAAPVRYEITPAFMGLLGAGGALPTFYTELFARREQLHKDGSPRRFLDIFVHRAVTLFYQAWRKHRLPLRYEADRRNEYLPRVLALAGLGQRALRDRLQPHAGGVADDALAFYSGLLQQRPVSAAAIAQILSHYFALPVRLEQFVGRWFTLPAAQQSRLGLGQVTLGSQAVVGERVWQRDLRLRLTLGPLDRERFQRFLPGGTGQRALHALLTLLTGLALEYDIRLCLRAADVAPATLQPDTGPRLGWDSFLITRPAQADRSDAGYDLLAAA